MSTAGMNLELSAERKETILFLFRAFVEETFDETMSDYRSERILEFFLRVLGPTVYNQAIQDARTFMSEKLEDLDVEYYRAETEK